jgi:hypothetical protein
MTVGTWIVPTFVTVAAFYVQGRYWRETTAWYDFDFSGPLAFLLAVIVSLTSWLIWALL